MESKKIDTQTITKLIEEYKNDILYDAHSLALRISRSEANQKLQKIGKDCLKQIGEELNLLSSTSSNENILNYDLFVAWIDTIIAIIDNKNNMLPEPPYARDVKYNQQKVELWITYCQQNGN